MRYFVSPQTVIVPLDLVQKAQTFAQQVTPTVGNGVIENRVIGNGVIGNGNQVIGKGYADSQQWNLQKIQFDHWISKIGEEAVRLILVQRGCSVEGPDYRIYRGKQKSWAADLRVNGLDLAVKTQSLEMAKRFGLSWTFQCSAHRKDPILEDPHAWVCFVQAEPETGHCVVYPPYQIQTLRFSEPKLSHLKGSKKVIYAQDLSTIRQISAP